MATINKKEAFLNKKRKKEFIIEGLTVEMGILAIGIYVLTRNIFITIFIVVVCFVVNLKFIETTKIYDCEIKDEMDSNKIKKIVKLIDKEVK
ncbi:hypothetical protein [Clostridium akagii]|uniref:hypothetical protein n=1 Tax=Clostridium akagii TaxID=91623 RepID=UPI00047A23F4|nr:hypothetical protein [Clostridium akagii]